MTIEFWIYCAGIFLILTGAIRIVARAATWVTSSSESQVRFEQRRSPFSDLLAPAADIAAIVSALLLLWDFVSQ